VPGIKVSLREDHVFINCPFDTDYKPLFEAIVFVVHAAGFIARSALEVDDGSENRLEKIMRLMAECKFGVHDISRTELDPLHHLPRFNMPFELGLFLACKRFGGKQQSGKGCLILDRLPHRYQQFLSDIAGQDIASHGNSREEVIRCVRNWLRTASGRANIPGATLIIARYAAFQEDLPSACQGLKIAVAEMTFADLVHVTSDWLSQHHP